MKKIFPLILLVLLPLVVNAYDAEIDGIYYNFSGDEATVTFKKYDGIYYRSDYSGPVAIPASVTYNSKTYTVTYISYYAFYGCSNLTSVTIPESVTSIGCNAFQYCQRLTSIAIPNSVTNIGDYAFNGCSGLTSINIPNSMTSIGESIFYNCSSLTSVTIPNSVTSIGYQTFYGCSSLTSITIPNSVSSIGQNAFEGTAWYNNQPDGLVYVGKVAYKYKGTMPEGTQITIQDGTLGISNFAFYNCSGLTSIIIPNSVTSIGAFAFAYCYNLFSLTVGSGVLSIGSNAFQNTSPKKIIWLTNTPPNGYTNLNGSVNYVANQLYTNLSNVTVYPYLSSLFEVDGVKYVPVSPSERTCDAIDCVYNESAEHIDIGETVTNRGITLTVKKMNPYLCYGNTFIKDTKLHFKGDISEQAFYSCSAMQTAELGQEITLIGEKAFYGCSRLEGIVIPDTVSSLGNNCFENCFSMTSVKMGNGVKTIPTCSFSCCSSLTDVQIGIGVNYIASYAFKGCSSLPAIQIPQGVATIDNYVFSGCTSLKTVLMDDGEKELDLGGNGIFASCPLDSVFIGRNITYPTASDKGFSPFYGNKKLRSVFITDKETEITPNEFSGCSALQTIQLGPEITSIGERAFYGCSKLESIVIPDAVNSLGNNCFENCSSMTSVKIGNGVKAIPTYTFSGCSDLTDMQIGTGVKPIHSYAFSGCSSLPTIQIPQNVTNISDYVFNGCTSLKAVLMDDGETGLHLGSNGSSPLFASCPLDSVYIGRNITYLTASNKGYSPFYRNTNLRSVTITDKETEVSPNEFYGCTNMKNVRLGDGITTIGNWAFSGCSSLDFFSFGSSVESIGKETFSDCTAMTKLYAMTQVPPTCGDQALDDINKWECTLMVPEGYVTAYQAAPQWKEFFFMEEFDPDGIETITVSEKAKEITRYDIQGRKLNAQQKGINIIHYSDGTTRKVMIK